jgi:hypothetical protein
MQEGIISFCRRQSVKQCWGQRMNTCTHQQRDQPGLGLRLVIHILSNCTIVGCPLSITKTHLHI